MKLSTNFTECSLTNMELEAHKPTPLSEIMNYYIAKSTNTAQAGSRAFTHHNASTSLFVYLLTSQKLSFLLQDHPEIHLCSDYIYAAPARFRAGAVPAPSFSLLSLDTGAVNPITAPGVERLSM